MVEIKDSNILKLNQFIQYPFKNFFVIIEILN